jgi:hypothetical protein
VIDIQGERVLAKIRINQQAFASEDQQGGPQKFKSRKVSFRIRMIYACSAVLFVL